MALPARKDERFNLRATPEQHALIRQAADRVGRTYTDFILESAMERAVDVLADRRVVILDDDRWNAFVAALDAPAQPVPALVALFKNKDL